MPSQRKLSHSQNFIKSSKLVRDLLNLSNISSEDLVVEIGPGKGIITRELLHKAGRVIAIEKDSRLAQSIKALSPEGNLELVIDDFLTWELPSDAYKVFANIPFNLTTDIITKLTRTSMPPTNAYLVMQEAAAHRFVGMPFEKNTQISILSAVNFDISIMRTIDRRNFEPIPNVNIAFVHFRKLTEPLISIQHQGEFRDFVVFGYNQWRPTVLEAFETVFSRKQRSILSTKHQLNGLKPSDLDMHQWIELYEVYRQHVNDEKKSQVRGSERRLMQSQQALKKKHRTNRNRR